MTTSLRARPGRPKARSGRVLPLLQPVWRKLVVLAHVVGSVGWLGVSAGFLVLTLALHGESDPATLRFGYSLHELTVAWLARPAALLTLFTGLVLALGTRWGLTRHWWVPAKLALLLATVVVTISVSPEMLRYAVERAETAGTPDYLRAQSVLVAMAFYHVGMIGAAAALSVFKPGGRTLRAHKQQDAALTGRPGTRRTPC
ncbi:MAG: DUF2269 family protein [Pseudonocardia sp.]